MSARVVEYITLGQYVDQKDNRSHEITSWELENDGAPGSSGRVLVYLDNDATILAVREWLYIRNYNARRIYNQKELPPRPW